MERLLGLGAATVQAGTMPPRWSGCGAERNPADVGQRGATWVVLADPEANDSEGPSSGAATVI